MIARERRAHLAVEPALGARERLGRGLEVDVVEDDRRRLPAELERAAGDPLAAERRDAPAGRGRSRERDLVDARVAHEQLRHLAVRGDDVQHAGRQADLLGDLGEHVALARCLGRRLEHDRAAGEQRGADLVADERDRRVPRDDRADHADRLPHEQPELAAGRRRALLLERERVGQRGVRRERARADPPGVLRRLVEDARLARPQLAEHVAALLEPGAERAEVVGALRVRQPRPRSFVERVPRRARPPETCRRARPPRSL